MCVCVRTQQRNELIAGPLPAIESNACRYLQFHTPDGCIWLCGGTSKHETTHKRIFELHLHTVVSCVRAVFICNCTSTREFIGAANEPTFRVDCEYRGMNMQYNKLYWIRAFTLISEWMRIAAECKNPCAPEASTQLAMSVLLLHGDCTEQTPSKHQFVYFHSQSFCAAHYFNGLCAVVWRNRNAAHLHLCFAYVSI